MKPDADQRQALLEVLDALDEATRAIAGVDSVDHVLQLIVDRVRPLVGARYAAIGTIDPLGRMDQFITSGIDDSTRRRLGDPPRGLGLLGLIVRERKSIRVPNIAGHPESHGFPPHHPPMTTLLGVPVIVKGRSVGRLYLTDKESGEEFDGDDERLVEAFAHHAGIAIENARLYEQLRGLTVMEERERIGRDLHDGIIQQLYGIGLSLEDVPDLMTEEPPEATARVERAIDSLHTAIRDLRTFVFGLRPELGEGSGTAAGLVTLAHTLIEPVVQLPPQPLELPADTHAELLAIAGEALSNIARHARATAVTIEFGLTPDGVRLVVDDNGVGLPPDEVGRPGHHGLANMRERARRLGGRLTFEGGPGSGTRLVVEIPMAAPRGRI
jgi:signal transduction histidine kinase